MLPESGAEPLGPTGDELRRAKEPQEHEDDEEREDRGLVVSHGSELAVFLPNEALHGGLSLGGCLLNGALAPDGGGGSGGSMWPMGNGLVHEARS